jgi:hypothetical protein
MLGYRQSLRESDIAGLLYRTWVGSQTRSCDSDSANLVQWSGRAISGKLEQERMVVRLEPYAQYSQRRVAL